MKISPRRIGIFTLGVVLILVGALLLQPQSLGPFPSISKSATVIDLRNHGLTSLPAEIGEYTDAVELLLDDNDLTGALPAEIRKMAKLEVLSAKGNQFTGIPAEIGQLRNLKVIDFAGNRISTYPNELLQLQQPLILNLEGNPFSLEQIASIKSAMPNADVRF